MNFGNHLSRSFKKKVTAREGRERWHLFPGTMMGLLLMEAKKQDASRNSATLKWLNDITSFHEEDRLHILYTLDALIKNVKLKQM